QLFKPVRQRLVRTHPVSGRKSLYLSSHAGSILGKPTPEARILLNDLKEHATQPRFVYVHKWKPHDLVMWDNRQTMHRGRRYDETYAGQPLPAMRPPLPRRPNRRAMRPFAVARLPQRRGAAFPSAAAASPSSSAADIGAR